MMRDALRNSLLRLHGGPGDGLVVTCAGTDLPRTFYLALPTGQDAMYDLGGPDGATWLYEFTELNDRPPEGW